MKFIYYNIRKFQFKTADSIYISYLSDALFKHLAKNFLLIIGGRTKDQFNNIEIINLNFSVWREISYLYFWMPIIYNFFWIPIFIYSRKMNYRENVFFSSDVNVLCSLIFWKKMFDFQYVICSDWHMIYNNWKDKYIANNSDYLITTSEKLKKLIIDRTGVNPNKVKTIYGAVDLESYKNLKVDRKLLGLPINKKLVGYVGLFKTMGMEKGITTMIEALKYLDQEIVMVFVGAKPGQAEEYIKIAKSFQVEDRCLFIDIQTIEKIPLYEKAMDVLVIPYPDKPHFRDWGFPMKVYEYMASRKPIIYSKLGLVEEVLKDNCYGFEPDNSHDLAKAINEAINSNSVGEKDENLLLKSLEKYSWNNKALEILKFIGFKI